MTTISSGSDDTCARVTTPTPEGVPDYKMAATPTITLTATSGNGGTCARAPMPVLNNNNNNGVVASTCARGATPPLGVDSPLGTATPPHCPAPHKCIHPPGTGPMGDSSDDDYDIILIK